MVRRVAGDRSKDDALCQELVQFQSLPIVSQGKDFKTYEAQRFFFIAFLSLYLAGSGTPRLQMTAVLESSRVTPFACMPVQLRKLSKNELL